jgi:cystathionine beta-lyase/cystathionine gamma-synthase
MLKSVTSHLVRQQSLLAVNCTDVTFPVDASITDRVLIIAATLMIDVIFFETDSSFGLIMSNIRSMISWLRGVPVLQTIDNSTYKL